MQTPCPQPSIGAVHPQCGSMQAHPGCCQGDRSALLQAVLAGFGQQQWQYIDAVIGQRALLLRGGGAPDGPDIDLTLVHLPGQVGKVTAYIVGVGNDLARQLQPGLLQALGITERVGSLRRRGGARRAAGLCGGCGR